MLQRLIAAVLGVLGVAAIGLGVASATVWRADDPLVATAEPGDGTRTLVTDPGVLELAGDPVTVTVRAEGSPVVLAVGRDTDVTAWVGSDPYARVTGLSDWHTLATTAGADPAATPAPSASATEEGAAASPSPSASGEATEDAATAADPTGNDMWVVEVTGEDTATLEWPAQEGRWSLLAVSLGDTAPVLDLSWPQTVTTPWLWPGVALGVLLLAVAAVLLVRIIRERREGPDAGWTDVSTGTLATVPLPASAGSPGAGMPAGAVPVGTVTPGAPLTRRQLREAEAAAAAARRRGGRTPTGSVPVVTGATPVVTGATPVVTGATPAAGDAAPGGDGPQQATPRAAGQPAPAQPTAPSRPGAPGQPAAAAQPTAPGQRSTPTGPTGSGEAAAPVRPAAPAQPAPAAQPASAAQRASAGQAPAQATPSPAATGRPGTPAPGTATAPGGRPSDPAANTAAGAADTTGAVPAAGPDAEPGPRSRRLADRLPWRRGRAADAHPDAPAQADGQDAPVSPARSSWSPVPAPGTGPTAGSDASSPAGGTAGAPGTTARPTAPAAPAAAAPTGTPAPGAPPAARPGTTAPAPGAAAGSAPADEDAATRAQRADAWRRMWGFPDAAPAPQDDDTPEEGR
ncbi:hypothetical protein [Cellulomonas pakistanensis]|uniref:Uncharacterized protein n=1 Tax=Cellulomonas pakistanensis TaxID=992287 RepID=A0A919U3X4_9CELL|nr:hypothetical protein [Cellulomonas pakistanensis]GIG37733.1 hypothetical protein Cpa01nite_31140 [Cellulomonas pakistanensis]